MRKLIKLVFLLVVLLVIGVVVAVIYIDSLARTGIEKGATYALGVDTTLKKASIGLVSGKFDIDGLNVANPQGFDAGPHFMNLGAGRLSLPLKALLEDKIVIPQIALDNVDLVLEKKGDDANYKRIMDNLKKLESGEKTEPAPAKGGGKKFVVKSVVINDVKVHAYVVQIGSAAARPVEVTIPRIEMTVDSDEGVTVQELTSLILKTVLTTVMTNAGSLLPGVIVDGLGQGLGQLASLSEVGVKAVGQAAQVVGEAGKVVGEAGKVVGDVAGQAGKAVGEVGKVLDGKTPDGKAVKDVADGVGKAVGEVGKGLKGIGDLFNQKPKDDKDKK